MRRSPDRSSIRCLASGVRIGAPQHFGSRIQPNSPGDDEDEILFSILEGLSYGCGDVIIGLNPAADELDTIVRLEQLLERVVQRLVAADALLRAVRHRQAARGAERTRASTSGFKALPVRRGRLRHGRSRRRRHADLARSFDGLYFETGQGSAVTNGAAEGVDMVTLESRAYGVARHIRRRCRTAAASGRG